MNRLQIVVVSVLAGLVAMVFVGLAIAILFLPVDALPIIIVTPTRTATATPTITLTPTFPNFMPTVDSKLSPEPTQTNTRVPTATPPAKKTATSTVVFKLPTAIIIPTATSTEVPLPPPPRPTVAKVEETATSIPLSYRIDFRADEESLGKGQCTDLEWNVQGAKTIFLDGSLVNPSGKKEVCPKRTKTYRLEVTLPGIANIEVREIEIKIDVDNIDPI